MLFSVVPGVPLRLVCVPSVLLLVGLSVSTHHISLLLIVNGQFTAWRLPDDLKIWKRWLVGH